MASTLYEPIMDAVLALIEAGCGGAFQTYSRRFITYQDLIQVLQSANPQVVPQPALYVYDGVGFGGGLTQYAQGGRTPSNRTLLRTLVIYSQLPGGNQPAGIDSTTPGADAIYDLIEKVEACFEPSPSSSLATINLGGLVTHCWIEGDGLIVPGDIDPNGQGMATLPLNILIP